MESNEMPNEIIINVETGEILNKIYPGDKLSITRKEQYEYANSHILNFNKDRSFVKIYDDIVPLLESYLNPSEFKFVYCLTPHISYEDCIIREKRDRTSRILSIKDIAEIHKYKYDYARKLMASLKNKGIIGKHETGSILENYDLRYGTVYTVNPFIFFRGLDINNTVYAFYVNSGWKELIKNN